MKLDVPSWFKYRQGKAEPAGTDKYKLTAPNMPESFIAIRQGDNGRWAAALVSSADGPELAATSPEFDRPTEAWEAAFELHRGHLIY
jgi:hypothetical protein